MNIRCIHIQEDWKVNMIYLNMLANFVSPILSAIVMKNRTSCKMEHHHTLSFQSIAVGGMGVEDQQSSLHEVPILLHVSFIVVGWNKDEVS